MFRSLALFSVLCLLVGCAEPETGEVTLEVENLRLVRERDGSQTVSGVVRNSSERMRSAQLEITLFGTENERVGEIHVPVERIEAGGIMGFEWSLDVDVEGVRLRSILSF
ncbi:MAG: hypothetical protein IIC18_05345 [Bacteroidetes bacterium]|nr:hypothetical protein [Bacteroidota bacterium]